MKNFHRNERFVLTVPKTQTQNLQKTPKTIDGPKIIAKALENSIKRSESLVGFFCNFYVFVLVTVNTNLHFSHLNKLQ